MASRVTSFLDSAFALQIGKFYPEYHQANLKSLREEFPEYDTELVDCLYRYSILLGECASEHAEKIYHRYQTEQGALDILEVSFKQFSKGTREWALENALSVYSDSKN